MNFLTPLFLAGALAVALPLVFHLIRRTTKERTVFSSLMFLKPTPPRLTRRSKLEHILLLLLRCAAICLLAAGFARPFVQHVLPETSSSTPPKRMVILVDTSASMRRANLWSQARDKVDSLLRNLTPADRVALFTFDRQFKPVMTFEEWSSTADRNSLVSGRLADVKPGWAATSLDQAIIRATEILSDADTNILGGLRQIVVVSDFQSGSKLSALQGQDWPKGVEVISERITVKTGNASLQLLAEANTMTTSSNALRLRVSNAPDSPRDEFQVGWAQGNGGFVGKAAKIYVPAGQSRIVTLPRPENTTTADRIILRGDDEEFDNAVFNVTPQAVRIPVLYFGSGSATNPQAPLYFVSRAFQATPLQQVEIVARQPASAIESKEFDGVPLIIVSDAVSASVVSLLRSQMQQGKTVLFAPTSADAAGTLGLMLGQSRLPVSEVVPRNYVMLGEIDFRHPLFAPFADARYSDFTKIHFWKYRRLDASQIPGARIVAKFDSGDPAIMEVPVGRGRLICFASGWSPADGQLALSTKFVPLLYSALDLSGAAPPMIAQFSVGDAVPLATENGTAGSPVTMTLPDGTSSELVAGTTNFTGTTTPGIYMAKSGTSVRQFAVNLDANEGRTAPLPTDELDRLGVPAHQEAGGLVETAQSKQQLKNAELEGHQKLWRWFVVATLAILILETAIAGWTARRTSTPAEAAV
jgi:hypothetical protein